MLCRCCRPVQWLSNNGSPELQWTQRNKPRNKTMKAVLTCGAFLHNCDSIWSILLVSIAHLTALVYPGEEGSHPQTAILGREAAAMLGRELVPGEGAPADWGGSSGCPSPPFLPPSISPPYQHPHPRISRPHQLTCTYCTSFNLYNSSYIFPASKIYKSYRVNISTDQRTLISTTSK